MDNRYQLDDEQPNTSTYQEAGAVYAYREARFVDKLTGRVMFVQVYAMGDDVHEAFHWVIERLAAR